MYINGKTSRFEAKFQQIEILSFRDSQDAQQKSAIFLKESSIRFPGAFVQKDMPSAELLYGKAIDLLASLPQKSEAALYSNRSMVRLNLNKTEGALEDAKKCLELDPKFVKAYHRKAQALLRLGEWDNAIEAAQAGSKLEPDNKSFQELIDKAQKDKEKDASDKAKLKQDAQDVRVELHNASTARAPPKPKGKENESSEMRGYKKTADGKTTSYFHTEISEEAKKLIEAQGFGKPQKLEAAAEDSDVKGGGSKWNQAGTYEEKGMTKWLEDRLKSGLVGVKFDLPHGGCISTTGIADLKGDCSISVSRGKRRHLMDVSFNVEYEAKVGDSKGKGKLAFSEVSTDGDDPEVKNETSSDVPPAIREILDAFAKPAGQGLQPLLLTEVKKMIEEYKGQWGNSSKKPPDSGQKEPDGRTDRLFAAKVKLQSARSRTKDQLIRPAVQQKVLRALWQLNPQKGNKLSWVIMYTMWQAFNIARYTYLGVY